MRLLTSLLPPSDQRGAEASHGSPPLHRGQAAIGTRAVQPKASRAGARDRWRAGSRERSNGYIVSAARQARCIPDRIRKTSRRVDRPERAFVAPTKAKEKKQVSKRRRLKRTICEVGRIATRS